MSFVMQQMRRVCSEYTDGTGGFLTHMESIESVADQYPSMSAERAKAFIEIVCKTIGEERGLAREQADLDRLVSDLAKQIPLGNLNHPDSTKINEILVRLVRSLNASVSALAQLNNIEGIRHGGPATWDTLAFHHGQMLLAFSDSLCAFLYEAHRRSVAKPSQPAYEDESEFNFVIDEEFPVTICNVEFRASEILWTLNQNAYGQRLSSWKVEIKTGERAG